MFLEDLIFMADPGGGEAAPELPAGAFEDFLVFWKCSCESSLLGNYDVGLGEFLARTENVFY